MRQLENLFQKVSFPTYVKSVWGVKVKSAYKFAPNGDPKITWFDGDWVLLNKVFID